MGTFSPLAIAFVGCASNEFRFEVRLAVLRGLKRSDYSRKWKVETGMATQNSTSTPIWKSVWLWLAVVIVFVLAIRWLPPTTADPLDVAAIDKEFHIGLKPLPSGWRTNWATDSGSARRVRLVSPNGDADIQVIAFKGELDKKRFTQIGSELFGVKFPPPYGEASTTEYGAEIKRSTYKELTKEGQTFYTSIDTLWNEGKEDCVYAVVASSFQESNSNVELARTHLQFSPPRLTAAGHVGKWMADGMEFLETWFAVLTWVLAAGWGIWYLCKKLDEKWPAAKYFVGIGIVGIAVAARAVLELSWLSIGIVISLVVASSGIAAALLTRAWQFED
jgi:hypothetical protein